MQWFHAVSCDNVTLGLFPSQDMALRSIRESCHSTNTLHRDETFAQVDGDGRMFNVVKVKASDEAGRLF